MGKIIWLAASVAVIVAGFTASQRSNNDMARIGGYCLAGAGAIFFISLLALV